MKIVLFGKNGQLGRCLERQLASVGSVASFDRVACDISDRAQVKRAIDQTTPDIVINAAAYTQVDKAETEPDICHLSNVVGPMNIAIEAAQSNAALIHFSTDYVFDGRQSTPYSETDKPNPQNEYGRSKLAGELAIGEAGASHIILRIGWLYSDDPASFLSRMVDQFKNKQEVSVVDDQRGVPISANLVAEMMQRLLQKCDNNPATFFGTKGGLYHLGCHGEASWFEFAAEILRLMKIGKFQIKTKSLKAIPSDAYPSAVKRPQHSKLNVDKWRGVFELEPMQWQDDLSRIMKNYNPATPD
ncbi:MAG: dTDP-4-dehydrorhamnose reductase [Rhodospirillales bacterium]|nr:dTDP-4-dehydrorhamnose reductase [Rhodospirillales bacterium]